MRKRLVAGIDLGGTKIATLITDLEGNRLARVQIPTEARNGPKSVLARMADSVYLAMDEGGLDRSCLEAVGIGSPGPLDSTKGIVLDVGNLGWKNVAVTQHMRDYFHLPVILENDANCAAYAEYVFGAGAGYDNMIYVTVSTGIGCGIITGGRVYRGSRDFAGEFGHICLEPGGRHCLCGNNGCLEAYASGTGIAAMMSEAAGIPMDSQAAVEAARSGDSRALGVLREAGERLGHGLSILVQLFDPGAIVLGGGVMNAFSLFEADTRRVLSEHIYRNLEGGAVICRAKLEGDAGCVGAARLAAELINNCTPLSF